MSELYKKHRPTMFKNVVGQEDAVRVLNKYISNDKIPHAILFTGPSGCGKTTCARILRTKLGCGDADFSEINSADFRGIDMVREIRSRMMLAPIAGKVRIWLIDECHKLSNDAQNALLKILEDTPKHVYVFLCTTDPEKLLTTIKTRCTSIAVKAMTPKYAKELLLSVAKKEGVEVTEEVIEKIIEHAEGSARKALVLLDSVIGLDDEEQQLQAIQSEGGKAKAIELARALLRKAAWPEVAKLIKEIDEEPESIRRMVLGYMSSVMLGTGKMTQRAFIVADIFQHNFYDTNKAGLVLACYAASR